MPHFDLRSIVADNVIHTRFECARYKQVPIELVLPLSKILKNLNHCSRSQLRVSVMRLRSLLLTFAASERVAS